MNRHFNLGLNVKEIILKKYPKHIVEVGAFDGANTKKIASLQEAIGFKLTVISDDVAEKLPGVDYIKGISYNALKDFPDESIDICIIDTDHNYWTLIEEMKAVFNKITEGGLILFHDVDTFYYDSGVTSYGDEYEYPREKIDSLMGRGSTGCAVIDFLAECRFNYKLEKWVQEYDGACAIRKKTTKHVNLMQYYLKPKEVKQC